MPVVTMPDGVNVQFPDDMPPDQIRSLIAAKFPQVAQQQQAQAKGAPVPMPLPSFRQGNQEIIPPMPRPRPMLGMGPGGNQRTYEIKAPDGRVITIRATDQQTAMRGAQEWVAANPISQPAASSPPQGQQPANGGQVTINIGGQRVKVGNEFMQMSPEMQNQTVDEIAGQIGIRPNGQPIIVQTPDGGTAEFPAGTSRETMERALQQQFPADGGGTNPLQIRLDQIGEGIRRAHAAGNTADVQALGNAYRQLQAQMSQQPSQGPDQEWLQQNPYFADLPIPGTISPNSPPPSQRPQPRTGAFENATAGLNNAIYSTLGLPVDAANAALRVGAAGINFATGSNIQLPENTIGGHQSIADAFGEVGVTDPADVVPANNFERSLRAAGEGAGYAIAPELMAAQLAKLGIVGSKAQQLMGQIFGEARTVSGTAGNMVAGATGGMGAQMAMDALPEDQKIWEGTAAVGGGLAGAGVGTLINQLPSLAGAGGRAIDDFLAPFTQGGREHMAGRQLREGATSPGSVIDAIGNAPSELVPGVRRQIIWLRFGRGLAECRPRLGVDVMRRACGAASADAGWSGV